MDYVLLRFLDTSRSIYETLLEHNQRERLEKTQDGRK